MTVINPHNMTRHYVLWGVGLCLMVGLAGILYWFQPQPVLLDRALPDFIKPIVAGVAAVCGVMALSFKYVFAQQLVAWALLEMIGVLGVILAGLFGYHDGWLLYQAVAFSGLLLLGPYLQFD